MPLELDVGGQSQSSAVNPEEKGTRYPSYRKLGGAYGRSGRMQKYLASTGIRTPYRQTHSRSFRGGGGLFALSSVVSTLNDWT
jgi:hypothetical protein